MNNQKYIEGEAMAIVKYIWIKSKDEPLRETMQFSDLYYLSQAETWENARTQTSANYYPR